MTEIVTWIAGGILAYALAGYPFLIWCLAWGKKQRAWSMGHGVGSREHNGFPPVSVVLCIYNGEKWIEARLVNLLAQEGLASESEIIVASDGSTDGTVARARIVAEKTGGGRIRVIEFPENRGKAAVLNDIIPVCKREIVVLCDVRQEFAPDAIRCLAEQFNNAEIGAVSGELVIRDGRTAAADGVGSYWSFEKWLRKMESRLDSTNGCTGAIYAIRKALFSPLDPRTVLDDVAIPMQAVLCGKRVIFEERAMAFDIPSAGYKEERVRKIRTLAGNLQLAALYPALINPFRNRIWFQFVSHKLLRLICPWLILVFFAGSWILAKSNLFWQVILLGQVLFCFPAVIGIALQRRALPRMFSLPAAFVQLQIWAMEAWFVFFSGKLDPRWGSRAEGEKHGA